MSRDIHKPDKEFAENIKTIQEVEEALNELLDLEFDSLTIESVKDAYYKKLTHLPISALPMEKATLEKLEVFRARVIDETKEDITKVSTFGAPLPEQCKDMGRANWPKKPVFYAGDRPITALVELKSLENGNEFFISKWSFDFTKTSNEYIHVSPFLFDNMSNKNPWNILMENKKDPYQEIKDDFGQEKADSLSYLNKQISKLFTSINNKHYHITAFISHQHIYSNLPDKKTVSFPILIYPSIQNNFDSCNLAIHPGFVKTYMYPTNFIHVKVAENSSNKLKVSCEKIGICKDRKNIEWYQMLSDGNKSGYKINFVGCPICGRLYYPDEFEDLKFTRLGKEITISGLVDEILLLDENSIINNLPPSFMESLNFPTAIPAKMILEAGTVTTVNCKEHSHINPHFNIDSISTFHYEPLNIKLNPPTPSIL